jgi:crotonobetaine/carnitine-CoA ligase
MGVSRTNIADLLLVADEHRDAPYIRFESSTSSFAETLAKVHTTASNLVDLGVMPSHRVMLLLRNCPEFVHLWLASAYIGGVLVPANPECTHAELVKLLIQAEPWLVVANSDLHPAVALAATEAGIAVKTVTPQNACAGHRANLSAASASLDDPVALIPTSGTTSQPKLVVQTHRVFLLAAEAVPEWLGLNEQDRLLTCLPLFHINGLVYSTLGAMACGASIAILPRFSPNTFWDAVEAHGATQFNAIGAMLEMLMRRTPDHADSHNTIRLCYSAPALGQARHMEVEQRFGFRLISGYALSECPFGTIWPLDEPPRYGSMGKLRQHPKLGNVTTACVVDDEGKEVAEGQPGELLLRGPGVMRGYYKMPEETEQAIKDGWLFTGDIVRADRDGYFYFVSRKKQMIRRRGENIAPAEIEEVLESHPAVLEAAVVGIPSELTEEDVRAFVVVSSPDVNEEHLREWCSARLMRHKVPESIVVLDVLPHTATGRVAKHLLVEA